MVENRPLLTVLTHLVLVVGVIIVAFPVYVAVIAMTHTDVTLNSGAPLLPGGELIANLIAVWTFDPPGSPPFWLMVWNSTVMALIIMVGKIAISIISAYAIVYFKFPFRLLAFWLIFITLMLPVEVRIIPTYEVVANLGMLNTYAGLTVPLIASATATFLFRQFFMTIPDEMMEAARVDGAGPIKFFRDILLPLSRTNIAALCIILFIYGWVQYLWPLLVTTREEHFTLMMGVRQMAGAQEVDPQWNLIMTAVVLAMLPPVLIVILMQRLFVKGLVETEK
ncbi:sn-glycerol-3-phosphate ABC transporter permease UgpE [Pelagibacterium sp. 26DY04]|uniref:sn-glycerol-3-phosphate ABC transporter permease UgpE n=1 Tax=Pelagibacterium sp. 26DY04 TaxID=2967130 RepID=UPI002815A54E|nr:sn-glycerol-3-phosphate ABC transporter permease UgpE [Pelagibacterium sp. 26DY04]WMT87237.1 sn-glycerol-3-phosphate ABC transporter permease UgpE [Pelagibacterium sp. 26DY04]